MAHEVVTSYKQQAAYRAVEAVRSGMVVGLGTGSTAIFAVRRLAALIGAGALTDIRGVPTSSAIEAEAARLRIPTTDAGLVEHVDLTIDGADEVDPALDLIKGGGGALLREKIVAQISRRLLIVVDESKLSPALGTRYAVPVEVVPFAWQTQVRYLESLGAVVTLRLAGNGETFRTDHGNFILDCAFGPLADPRSLASTLAARAGIVEHGLFLALATEVIVAGETGIRHLTPVSPGQVFREDDGSPSASST